MLPYDDVGSGRAVVLLHAGVADRSMWREQLHPLAEAGHRAIAVDLPGFGEAAIRAGEQAPWNDVLVTMRRLELARATLVGNSFGAAVALRAAVVAPAAVSALALISPPPLELEASEELAAAWEAEETALERGDIDAAVAAVVEAWLQPDAPEALRQRVASMQRRAFELQADAPGVREAPDPLEQHPQSLAAITVPALAAAGEHDMSDFKRGAEELATALPQGRLAVIEGARHLAPLEVPEAFGQLLLEFLRAVASAEVAKG